MTDISTVWELPIETARAALAQFWGLPAPHLEPIRRGMTADVWRVTAGSTTWVAKFAYDFQATVEAGLLAAEVAQRAGLRAAVPQRTVEGSLTVLLPGPPGHEHPLALMAYVEGTPLDVCTESGAGLLGEAMAQVREALNRADVYLPVERRRLAYLDFLRSQTVDLDPGEAAWVQRAAANAVDAAEQFEDTYPVTYGYGVWDGPEVLVDVNGRLGLIDWGVVAWQPVMLGLACQLDQHDPARRAATVAAYHAHCRLDPTELDSLAVYRRVSLAIYAKYSAMLLTQRHTIRGGLSHREIRQSLDALRALLERFASSAARQAESSELGQVVRRDPGVQVAVGQRGGNQVGEEVGSAGEGGHA